MGAAADAAATPRSVVYKLGLALRRCRLLLALAAVGAAAAQTPCSTTFTVTLRNFNKAGAGPGGNPDFGFLPEPANVNDRKIVKAVLPAAGQPSYRPATSFNTSTTHSEFSNHIICGRQPHLRHGR